MEGGAPADEVGGLGFAGGEGELVGPVEGDVHVAGGLAALDVVDAGGEVGDGGLLAVADGDGGAGVVEFAFPGGFVIAPGGKDDGEFSGVGAAGDVVADDEGGGLGEGDEGFFAGFDGGNDPGEVVGGGDEEMAGGLGGGGEEEVAVGVGGGRRPLGVSGAVGSSTLPA